MVVTLNGEVLQEGRKFYGDYVIVRGFPWIHCNLSKTDVITVEIDGETKSYTGFMYWNALMHAMEPELYGNND